jgi:hypothetical protein
MYVNMKQSFQPLLIFLYNEHDGYKYIYISGNVICCKISIFCAEFLCLWCFIEIVSEKRCFPFHFPKYSMWYAGIDYGIECGMLGENTHLYQEWKLCREK